MKRFVAGELDLMSSAADELTPTSSEAAESKMKGMPK